MSVGRIVTLAAERVLQPVEGMHRAIAESWFSALGSIGHPVRVAHHAISRVVYGSIRVGATAVGVGLDTRVVSEASPADPARAFVNGLWGDALGRHGPGVATAMGIHDRCGQPIPMEAELAEAFPGATDRLVVLVHGLMKTERCWHDTDDRPGLIRSLEDDPLLTPVAVRYNTGLAVADNGTQLAALLENVHAGWPQPVRSITLVGHSMGGLVIRSACATAVDAGYGWIADVSDVVTIGTPHRGAPLAKLARAAAWGLGVAPHTRPLAEFLDTRSRGIKDLGGGSIAFMPGDELDETAPPSHINHHFVAGVITPNPAHPLGAVVGDLMVRPASSTSTPTLEPTNVVVLGGVSHFDLLHEPAVIDQVMDWLAPSG